MFIIWLKSHFSAIVLRPYSTKDILFKKATCAPCGGSNSCYRRNLTITWLGVMLVIKGQITMSCCCLSVCSSLVTQNTCPSARWRSSKTAPRHGQGHTGYRAVTMYDKRKTSSNTLTAAVTAQVWLWLKEPLRISIKQIMHLLSSPPYADHSHFLCDESNGGIY